MKIKFLYEIDIENQIQEILMKRFIKAIQLKQNYIKKKIAFATANMFRGTEEYISLTSGDLMGHFGLEIDRATEIVEKIIKALSEEIEIIIEGDQLLICCIKADFADILSMEVSSYKSVNKKGNITDIPWLRWFLLDGDRILVEGFHIDLKDYTKNPYSRSKKALMIQGGNWRPPVNPKFSGVITDNWITATVFYYLKTYKKIIRELLEEIVNV